MDDWKDKESEQCNQVESFMANEDEYDLADVEFSLDCDSVECDYAILYEDEDYKWWQKIYDRVLMFFGKEPKYAPLIAYFDFDTGLED